MSHLSYNDIAKIIYVAARGKKDNELADFVDEIIKFLLKQKLITKSSIILKKLENILNQEDGIIVAKIYTVKGMTSNTKKSIETFLLDKYKAKKIVFLEKHDPKLIGGLKIEIGNEVIDLSVSNKLKKLKDHLTN